MTCEYRYKCKYFKPVGCVGVCAHWDADTETVCRHWLLRKLSTKIEHARKGGARLATLEEIKRMVEDG